MKNLILLTFLMVSGFALSQEFVLTKDNFKSKENQEQDYVVIDNLDMNSKELFDKVKM